MRLKAFSIFFLVAAAVMSMGLLVSPLQASQYLGEVCWDGQEGNVTFTMKAGISRVGDSHYQIQGQKMYPIPGQIYDNTSIFSGGGVLMGNHLIFVVTEGPTSDGSQQCAVMHIMINKTTCNGTFSEVKPIFFISRNTIIVSEVFPYHENVGSGPEKDPPYSNQFRINSHISGASWPNPEDIGKPAVSGTLTATKTVSLTPKVPLGLILE